MAAPAAESPEIPSWLNNEFFQGALESDFPGIRVRSTHVEAAVAVGENYACIVYRAIVGREEGADLSLIIKVLPTAEFRAQMVREGEITLREVRMYKETLELLGDPCNHPKCFYAVLDNVRDAVVLDDLRPKGYKTRDRRLGLDLVHSKLVMEQIGRLHGSGIALRINDPETFERDIKTKYPDIMFGEFNREKMTPFIQMSMNGLADAVKFNFPMRFHALAEMMKDMADYTFDVLHESLKLPSDPEELDKTIFTLNHGDTWSNNILFKYEAGDESTPLDCVLIDFQISRAVPAVIDLLYFFNSSTKQELRQDHMDELLQIYWNAARTMLKERGVTYPGKYFFDSVEDIKIEMKKSALTGFLLGCFIMPIVIANADDAPNFDDFTEESIKEMDASPFIKMYSGQLFCSRFREILEEADDCGVFESKAWQKYKKLAAV